MPSTNATTAPSEEDRQDIQGNLVGFNKDHQRLLFFNFGDAARGKAWLEAMAEELDGAEQVLKFNEMYKQYIIDPTRDPDTLSSSGVNLLLSAAGLSVVGAPGLDVFPTEFAGGMAARASVIGDVGPSDPSGWLPPFNAGAPDVHAMVIVAADEVDDLERRTQAVLNLAQAAGVAALSGTQEGDTRPLPERGHEHFGFRDGISQPSVRGLATSSKGGGLIAAGEFLVGYEDQDGHVSGQPQLQPPSPGQPGYNPIAPTPPSQPLPDWTKNGSFVVYRRLRQDVQGFQGFLAASAAAAGLSSEQIGAKLVGRWPSGAPLEHVPGLPADVDPAAGDPSIADPGVLADIHINNFGYQKRDADGHLTPRAAHIRKVYPRDEQPPAAGESDRHRILRRGIPYGPEMQPGEPAYPGQGAVPDTQDRGLLFFCYQSSITRGFEFVQSQWANNADFPQAGDGQDPIITQTGATPEFSLPPGNPHLALVRWVITTGGDYFFAPSISAVKVLAGSG